MKRAIVLLALAGCGGMTTAEIGLVQSAATNAGLAYAHEDASATAALEDLVAYCDCRRVLLGHDAGTGLDASIACPTVQGSP